MPTGHRVLGQVGMGPLVDIVRDAVAPGLEELRRGPGVVDLVEVHAGRLVQAERPQPEGGDDEHDQDPDVEAVQAATTLAGQLPRAVGANGRLAHPGTDPADGPSSPSSGGRTRQGRSAAEVQGLR